MSGFVRQFVGLNVGFLELPDTLHSCRIISLQPKCRVCRVLLRVEPFRDAPSWAKYLEGEAIMADPIGLE